jgi:Zn ribbon nucleic-acid-binding protein
MLKDEDDEQRKIPHKYLQGTSNGTLKFLRMTDEPCPACGRGPTPNKLAVLFEDPPRQETVHCVSCDYQVTRKPKLQNRPMNSGRRG